MQYRPLGQSGISASVVGLGTWVMGGWMWGGADESESIRAIHAALDSGINLIDTAPIYGFGLSEELVGKAIKDRRDRVVLATKCNMVCDPNHGRFFFRSTGLGPDPNGLIVVSIYGGADSIRRGVDESLARLQTDYIDLLQTHWQDTTTPLEETMGALMDLKRAGKIRAIGVSNATSAQMDEYRRVGPLDSDQEKYSMLARGIEQDQLPYCHQYGIAMLAYSPLGQGLLTGKVDLEREFAEGDMRRTDPLFSKENRQRIAGMLDRMRPIADAHHVTLGQLVVGWTYHQPGLTHVLCGARNASQAQENAAGGDIQLNADELNTINAALADYTAGR